jgi:hypothetical protein
MSAISKPRRWPIVVAISLLAGVGTWLALTSEGETAEHVPVTDKRVESIVVVESPTALAPRRTRPTHRVVQGVPSLPDQTLVVVGADPHAPHEPGMVPHPLDETRARINAENQLLQSLNDAMSFRKVKEMREMLVEYHELDPRDIDAHQLGYEIIADCIEFPGDASLTAAREFYDTQRHSPLRRFVRRICFENRN